MQMEDQFRPTNYDNAYLSERRDGSPYGVYAHTIGPKGLYAYHPAVTDDYRSIDRSALPLKSGASHHRSLEMLLGSGKQGGAPGGGSASELRSHPEHFLAEPYGLEDDQRSYGGDDDRYVPEPRLAMLRRGIDAGRGWRPNADPMEEAILGERAVRLAHAPLAQAERGSVASMDRLGPRAPSMDSLRKVPQNWREPDLREVVSMLKHYLDPVKANAAAYLQHICFKDEAVKVDVRRLGAVPSLVSLLDSGRRPVHISACGALRNLAFGREPENKIAIARCNGIQELVRLLRRTQDVDVIDMVTGILWNLSSHEPLKTPVAEHALQSLTDLVLVPFSGWDPQPNEDSKPRDLQHEPCFCNTVGCLRNLSSGGSSLRRQLRNCDGVVDALLFTLQSAISKKQKDGKVLENCVSILRNLSFRLHQEAPGAESFRTQPNVATSHETKRLRCFRRKGKAPKNEEPELSVDTIAIPKRSEPARGLEKLYQPEVVRPYLSLLSESPSAGILEASAGALQNLTAGDWTWSEYIRATVRGEKGLPILVDLLRYDDNAVIASVATALRNLALDPRNKSLIGKYAIKELLQKLPGGPQSKTGETAGGQTSAPTQAASSPGAVLSLLCAVQELVTNSADNATSLKDAGGLPVLTNIARSRSEGQVDRQSRLACTVLLQMWKYSDIRKVLKKDGWSKSVLQATPSKQPAAGGKCGDQEDKKQGSWSEESHTLLAGRDGYSTLDCNDKQTQRGTVASKDLIASPPGEVPMRLAAGAADGDGRKGGDSWV
uniref:ARVCF delta catenin family member a n=1 Tax=Eptatretus burgeri TaxID=7764 RepID=A0A8C4Q745_EPTBU